MASTDLPATLVQQIACNVLSVAAAAIPLEVVEHTKAVLCSLFAAEGMTGPLGVIEHPRGLSTGMLAGAKLDLLVQPIGERYRIMTSAIKAYPCIATAQTMVAGVLQARAGIPDPAREGQRIDVVMADIPIISAEVADEQRRYPASRESADHSFT